APVLTQRGPSTRSAPANPPPYRDRPLPEPFPTPPQDNTPDMASTLKERQKEREEREARDGVSPGGNASPQAPDRDSIIVKNLARNQGDKNGIFQVRDLGVRTAVVVFRGWGDDPRQWRGEQFDVDAGQGGDVEAAVVNTVIQRIRRDYPEKDFDWESSRLGKVIRMSARKKDTAELSAFLRVELFGRRVSR
ncbi:MAG: hypothetical protein JWN73_4395, partial [Betaproteobacteria bacterium]|nr:hypothetical protein [Betaproteobacteria bacterium]